MQSPRLPWEVLERVIGHSRDRPNTLRSFSLTCRDLLPRSRCLMLAAGVDLKSRDHTFELVNFLEDNPHLKVLIGSITVHPEDLQPSPLLRILSELSEITFTRSWKNTGTNPLLHPSYLSCFRTYGSHVQTLRLFDVQFSSPSALAQLLLAFSSLTHLVCNYVPVRTGPGHTQQRSQAPLSAIVKQRLSKKLRLRSLVSNSWSLDGGIVGDVLLDPNVKIASAMVESFEITDCVRSEISSVFRLSEWSQLQSLTLHLDGPEDMDNCAKILDSVNSMTCKKVTTEFTNKSLGPRDMRKYLSPIPSTYTALEDILLKFSLVNIIWNMKPLRAPQNFLWTEELKELFPMLSRPKATFALKADTVFPPGHTNKISCFVTSPDSRWIASGSDDSTVILWNTQDGSIAFQWVFPLYQPVHSLAFSPDSRYLLGGGMAPMGSSLAAVWDLWNDVDVAAILNLDSPSTEGSSTCCAWSPNGTVIATVSCSDHVKLWDASTFQLRQEFRKCDHRDTPWRTHFYPKNYHPNIAFSPDGRWLAIECTFESSAYICQMPTDCAKDAVPNIVQHSQEPCRVYSLPIIDSRSKHFLTVSHVEDSQRNSMVVEVREIDSQRTLFSSPPFEVYIGVKSASFSSDGKLVLAISDKRVARIWDINSGIKLLELEGHHGSPGSYPNFEPRIEVAHFSPCGKYIASGGDDGRVALWRVSDGTCIAEFSEHAKRITHIDFSPDGITLSSASFDGVVIIRRISDIIPGIHENA